MTSTSTDKMLTDLFLLLLILCPFEGSNINITDSMFPNTGKILQNNQQLSSNWSFMAVIVYGKRVLCAGTAFNEKWLITLAHCVHGILMEENLVRFGEMSVRLGAAPISYKKIKEVEIKNKEEDEDDEFYAPVVDYDELLPVHSVVVHPEYIYKENYQINTSLAFVGVNDLALVNFKKGPTFSVPSLLLYPDFSGWCVAAGWALSISKEPLVRNIHEYQLYIGDKKQCQPYLDISADEIPTVMKEDYKMNKICSLQYNDVYFQGFEDADGGGPLICNHRLQGIISHYYKKVSGDYFNFFYDLTQFVTWIRKQISEVAEFEISKKGMDMTTPATTTNTSPTTTTETTTTISTQVPELEINGTGNGRATTPTTTTTAPTTTINMMTIISTHSAELKMGKARPTSRTTITKTQTTTTGTMTNITTRVEELGMVKGSVTTPITTTMSPTTTIQTTTTISTQVAELEMGKGRASTLTTMTTSPTTTETTITTTFSTHSRAPILWKTRPDWGSEVTLNITPTTPTYGTTSNDTSWNRFVEINTNTAPTPPTSTTYETTSNDTSWDIFVDWSLDTTGTPTTPTTIGTTLITKDYLGGPRLDWASPIAKTVVPWRITTTSPSIVTRLTTFFTMPTTTTFKRKLETARFTTGAPRRMSATNDLPWSPYRFTSERWTKTSRTTETALWANLSPRRSIKTNKMLTDRPIYTNIPPRWTVMIENRRKSETFRWTKVFPKGEMYTNDEPILTIEPDRQDPTGDILDPTADLPDTTITYSSPKPWILKYLLYFVLGLLGLFLISFIVALIIMAYQKGCRCLMLRFRKLCRNIKKKRFCIC